MDLKVAQKMSACKADDTPPPEKTKTVRPADDAGDAAMVTHYGRHALHPVAWSRADTAYSKAWKTEDFRWLSVIRRAERPLVRREKDGAAACFVRLDGPDTEIETVDQRIWIPGGTRRLLANIVDVTMIGFDYDTGDLSVEEMIERLEALGFEALVYTSHSHLKTATSPSASDIAAAQRDGVGIVDWMRDNGKLPAIGEPAPMLLADGTITHAAWPKFRVVVLLKDPFRIGKCRHAADLYKRGYQELAARIGASTIDPSCSDPARAFYLPVKRSNDAHYSFAHIRGEPIDFDEVVRTSRPLLQTKAVRVAVKPPARQKGAPTSGQKHNAPVELPEEWRVTALLDFELASALAAQPQIEVRGNKLGEGKIEIVCPFDDEHSNAGDPSDSACFVVNASAQQANDRGARWSLIRCMHAHCRHRQTDEFIAKLIADGVIALSLFDQRQFKITARSVSDLIAALQAKKKQREARMTS